MENLIRNKLRSLIESKEKSFEPKFYSVKDRMMHYSERKEKGSDLPKKILDRARIKKVGKLFDCDLWTVDGETIRNESDLDFTTGGNPARYVYVPEGDIWVEKTFTLTDFVAIAIHEYTEYVFMKFKDIGYSKAHDKANEAEGNFRNKVEAGKIKVKDYAEALKMVMDEVEAHFKDKDINLKELLKMNKTKIKIKESQLIAIKGKLNEAEGELNWYYNWVNSMANKVNGYYNILLATNIYEIINGDIDLTKMYNDCYAIGREAHKQYNKAYQMIEGREDDGTDLKIDDANGKLSYKLDTVQLLIDEMDDIRMRNTDGELTKPFADIKTHEIK